MPRLAYKKFLNYSFCSCSTWEGVYKPRSGVGWQQWLGGPPAEEAPFRKAFHTCVSGNKISFVISPSSVFTSVTVWVIEKLIGVLSFLQTCSLPQEEWEGKIFSPLSKSNISNATARVGPGTSGVTQELVRSVVSGVFSGGPVAKTLCSRYRGAQVPSLVRELDPACHN